MVKLLAHCVWPKPERLDPKHTCRTTGGLLCLQRRSVPGFSAGQCQILPGESTFNCRINIPSTNQCGTHPRCAITHRHSVGLQASCRRKQSISGISLFYFITRVKLHGLFIIFFLLFPKNDVLLWRWTNRWPSQCIPSFWLGMQAEDTCVAITGRALSVFSEVC